MLTSKRKSAAERVTSVRVIVARCMTRRVSALPDYCGRISTDAALSGEIPDTGTSLP